MQNKLKNNDQSFSSEERDNEIVTLDYDTYQGNEIIEYDHVGNDSDLVHEERDYDDEKNFEEENIDNYNYDQLEIEQNKNHDMNQDINHDMNQDEEEDVHELAEIANETEKIKNSPSSKVYEPEYIKQTSNDTKSNFETKSEFNVELKTNQQFINMDHFDEASRAGFTINYINYDSNSNINFNSKNDDFQPRNAHEDQFYDQEQSSVHKESPKKDLFLKHDYISNSISNSNCNDNSYFQDSIRNKQNFLLSSVENRINEQEEENDQIKCEDKTKDIKVSENDELLQSSNKNKENINIDYTEFKNSHISHNSTNSEIEKPIFKLSEQPYYDNNYEPLDYQNLSDRDMLIKFKLIENSALFKNFTFLKNPYETNILKNDKIINKAYSNSKSSNSKPIYKLNHKSHNKNLNLKEDQEPSTIYSFNHSSTSFRKSPNIFTDIKNKTPRNTNKISYAQDNSSISHQDLDNKLKGKDEQIKALQEELRYLTANYDKTVKSLEILEIKFIQRDRENNELNEKVNILHTDYEETQVRINELLTQKLKIQSDFSEKTSNFEKLLSEKEENENKINKYFDENLTLKNQIDVMKVEIKMQQNEIIKKNDKITDLQQENVTLEHEVNDLRSKSTNELSNLRESKQSFDMLKSNYYEIKNQYELMSMKYQSIADENFNIRRDLLLYEKEIKNKNETIERQRREIIESNKKNLLGEMNSNSGSNLNLNLNLNNILKGTSGGAVSKYDEYETNDRDWLRERESNEREKELSNVKNKRAERGEKERENTQNKIKKSVSKNDLYEQNLEEFNKTGFKGSSGTVHQNKEISSNNYFSNSSATSASERENKIKFIENKMSNLNREREAVQAEWNKLPQHPKKRDQIAKKQELEDKVENYGRELALLKVELKDLTSKER